MSGDRAVAGTRLEALAVRAQWAAIDALLRRVQALEERLGEAEAQASAAAPVAPPPHF